MFVVRLIVSGVVEGVIGYYISRALTHLSSPESKKKGK